LKHFSSVRGIGRTHASFTSSASRRVRGCRRPPNSLAPGGNHNKKHFGEWKVTMTPIRGFLLSFAIGLVGLFGAHSALADAFAQPLVVGTPAGPIPTA
jgi:hypothetical protein